MRFEEWAKEFNQLYICKVFPANWQKFSIDSLWDGKTAGGKYPDLEEHFPAGDRLKKPYVELDTDDKWFNNPQFRIRVYKKTKLIISLMQEDQRSESGTNNYIKCNFIVVQSRQKKSRIWVKPEDKNICCVALKDPNAKPKREITQTLIVNCFEGKNFGNFIVIPNTEADNKKDENRPFWLRIFASEYIDVEELPESMEVSMKGIWGEDNAGGPRKIIEEKNGKKQEIENPFWCKNPQYFINIKQPTHLKIILKKEDKAAKKIKETTIGLCICRHTEADMDNLVQEKQRTNLAEKRALMNTDQTTKLLHQTQQHLQPPVMDVISRKLMVGPQEFYKESTFSTNELAAMYFHFLPIEGPFVIVPCLDKVNSTAKYKLTIFSNNPIEVRRLNDNKNSALIGEWEPHSAGGCDLYDEKFYKNVDGRTWINNPTFDLSFKSYNPASVKITLLIAEKNWRHKITKIFEEKAKQEEDRGSKSKKNKKANLSVGSMISIYLLKKGHKISRDSIITQSSFMPTLETELKVDLQDMDNEGTNYTIMPTTYYPFIEGKFI